MQEEKSEEDSFKACHIQGQGARVNCGVKRRWEKKEMGGEMGVDPRQQRARMAPGLKRAKWQKCGVGTEHGSEVSGRI